jgi:excisionase family DNA binding protein
MQNTFCKLPPLPKLRGQGADIFPPFSPVRWLTCEEAAPILRMSSERGLYKYIKAGRLKASWVGRQWLISEIDLQTFIQSCAE